MPIAKPFLRLFGRGCDLEDKAENSKYWELFAAVSAFRVYISNKMVKEEKPRTNCATTMSVRITVRITISSKIKTSNVYQCNYS